MEPNQSLRILIIDPEAKHRGFVKFGAEGFFNKNKLLTGTFEEAASALDARALLDAKAYDAVFCNPALETPEAGIELTRHIRASKLNSKTVVIGASRELEAASAMLEAGANDYVPLEYMQGYNPLAQVGKVMQKQLIDNKAGFVAKLEETVIRPQDPDVTKVQGSRR